MASSFMFDSQSQFYSVSFIFDFGLDLLFLWRVCWHIIVLLLML